MITMFLPRGIRNNNPGNIRLSKIEWQGQKRVACSDKEFVEFVSPLYGIRALMRLLLTYYRKYDLDSVEAVLNRFAPPCENATDSYIYHVSKQMKVKRNQKLDLFNSKTLMSLTKAIVLHENGTPIKCMPKYWYEDEIYKAALKLALS